jgi:tRNA A37 threonylcarbamoyladenosine synthetase subunit TsaC/SUA5/YrdC
MEQVEQTRSSGGTSAGVEERDVPQVAKQPRFVGVLADTLLGGGVALVHSDLGYVVLAHALDREGVERVRSMPGLPASPMRLITDPEGAHRVAVVTARARQLIFQTWPGTLALRVPRRRWLPSWAGSRDSVTLLCPDAFLWRTARTVGAPLVFRFALPTVERRGVCPVERMGDDVDLVVDGGLSVAVPMTLLDLTSVRPRVASASGAFEAQRLQRLVPGLSI